MAKSPSKINECLERQNLYFARQLVTQTNQQNIKNFNTSVIKKTIQTKCRALQTFHKIQTTLLEIPLQVQSASTVVVLIGSLYMYWAIKSQADIQIG